MRLSDHFTYSRLIRFTLPSVGTVLFTSLYSVVDGFFVSNFVGKTAFAAVTLIFPLLGILGSVGFMFGAGGAALVGKRLGQGKQEDANKIFSLLLYTTFFLGVILAVFGSLILNPTARILGAEGEIFEQSVLYGQISLFSLPAFMLQFFFQFFFVTAEKPKLGFLVTVLSGCTNIFLDFLCIVVLGFGLKGAAFATVLSECVGGFLPVLYFARANTSMLRLGKTRMHWAAILRAATNGFSEFLINIAYPFLMTLYTMQLLRYCGEDGVAAFGVLLYVSFVFSSLFLGYAIGAAPLISYNFGAKRLQELTSIFAKSIALNLITGFILSLIAYFAAKTIAWVFTGYDEALCVLTTHALTLYAPVFFLSAINIYGSSFFTAMNNGLVSACISCLRTLVFGVLAIETLPLLLGTDGIWIAWSFAEFATLIVTFFFFKKQRALAFYKHN